MGAESKPIRRDHVEQALAALEGHEHAEALGALAYDALSGQAEGRALLAGPKYAQAKAEAHDVERAHAETEAGNLLGILERGATEPLERALVVAFAARGLVDALAEDDDARSRAFRFVRHADWLEVATDYSVYPFVDALLDDDGATLLYAELSQRVVDDAAGRDGDRPRVRALNAARLSALAASRHDAASDALRDVVRSAALDEPTRLLASTLAGDGAGPATASTSAQIEGELGRAPRGGFTEVVRWLTGWALLSWAARGLAFLLGLRRRATLRIAPEGLEVKTQVSLLGRTVREGEETWKLDALAGAGRQVRYPAMHLLVGTIALSVGVLLGGLVLFDGVRSGELILLGVASVLLLGGAGLDLALDVLVPARAGRCSLELSARAARPLRLTRVPLEQADAFLRALRQAATKRA